jgi:DeoR/GlpR family transcriptional regulator of sugar metabolism
VAFCTFLLCRIAFCVIVRNTRTIMFAFERHVEILAVLASTGRLVTAEFADRVGVSIATVRRDLAELEAAGALRRVHGGAVSAAPLTLRFTERLSHDDEARPALARRAAETLPRSGLLAIAGGTTTLLVARHLHREFRGVVVTSSPDVALALREHPGAEVDLLGGRLNRESQTVTGHDAVAQLMAVRPDACVIGSCGVDAVVGVTFHERDEAHVVRAMIERSAWAVVLATSGKVGAVSPYVVAPPERIDVLVTDGAAEGFEARGVQVMRP